MKTTRLRNIYDQTITTVCNRNISEITKTYFTLSDLRICSETTASSRPSRTEDTRFHRYLMPTDFITSRDKQGLLLLLVFL